ncbi:hypothetical protein [Blastococcus sp. VKM Ac-2987]|uniref:hypothetical protein n=1 Tax=Blastococcus sp. VKM Ac-2987 TaxID=3004141 RepID=UPI0022AB5DFE|nr:hypothetical protein [Blastococcus sp. VKM Ac-2987]MCZ2860953.1 hypothetical protein [Blastococcus sp. VKM Ac-2987]
MRADNRRYVNSLESDSLRAASWVGGTLLLPCGAAQVLTAAAVLSGVLHTAGPVDRARMLGHLLLRDPLFALCGASLLVGLARTRHRSPRVSP